MDMYFDKVPVCRAVCVSLAAEGQKTIQVAWVYGAVERSVAEPNWQGKCSLR